MVVRAGKKESNKDVAAKKPSSKKANTKVDKKVKNKSDSNQGKEETNKNVNNTKRNYNFLADIGMKALPMSPNKTSSAISTSELKVMLLQHFDKWIMVFKVFGKSWCDKLFWDDARNVLDRENENYCTYMAFQVYDYYENNVRKIAVQDKDIAERVYLSYLSNGKPKNNQIIFILKNLCDGFNDPTKKGYDYKHVLSYNENQMFFNEDKKKVKWSDIIGDVAALHLLNEERGTGIRSGMYILFCCC